MKYKFTSYIFWAGRIMILFCICFSIVITIATIGDHDLFSLLFLNIVNIVVIGLMLYCLRCLPLIIVDQKGVCGRLLFRDCRAVTWEQIREVGLVCMKMNIADEYWFYFSTVHLEEGQMNCISRIRPPILRIKRSKRALKAIREFYKGEIRNLSPQQEEKLLGKGKKFVRQHRNKIKIIKNAFDFLLRMGFASSYTKSNLEYCVKYSLPKIEIAITYDLRMNRIDVGIIINKKNNYGYNPYIPLFEANISNESCIRDIQNKINAIYLDAKKDWTITSEHFSTIVGLYAEYVNANIEAILAMQASI